MFIVRIKHVSFMSILSSPIVFIFHPKGHLAKSYQRRKNIHPGWNHLIISSFPLLDCFLLLLLPLLTIPLTPFVPPPAGGSSGGSAGSSYLSSSLSTPNVSPVWCYIQKPSQLARKYTSVAPALCQVPTMKSSRDEIERPASRTGARYGAGECWWQRK